jgi:TPR repeat protein
MPEVPQNMQQDLQRMELEARSASLTSASSAGAAARPAHGREPSLSTVLNTKIVGYGQQYQQPKAGGTEYSPASNYSQSNYSPFQDSADTSPQFEKKMKDMARDIPSFSPFPKVGGEHIPPSDDEKEAVLAESREHVLHSNDPNMQICWARDVLSYVEIAAEAAVREFETCRKPGDRELGRPPTPRTEHELRLDAVNIVSYLADQGHPEAVFIRSKWLEFGKFGKRQDKKEAYSGYATAAQQGWGRAEYRIGMLYENSNDVDKALRHYHAGLEMKDSAASYRLGMISLMGQHNQRRDIPRGLELIHSAADSADEDAPQGAFVYGMIIARDLPDVTVPEGLLSYDVSVARQYIEKAAYLGFAKAQLKMGQAYELCQLGCEFNPALSLHYYGLAAKQGQPEACLGVSRWFLFGYEGTFVKNEQLAFKYAQLAAKAKLPTGEFAMGYYYEIGIFVEKDLREARKWYELAAEHGNKDALGRIDGLTQSKTLTKQDHETTALTRIKSQHGSQRGKRPERFKQNNALPTLSEGEQGSPRVSPRVSPQPSPRNYPYDQADMPDASRPNSLLGGSRAPGFNVNLPGRPKSAAPYPDDDRPPPLNLGRPKSTAPYPEDDTSGGRPPASPYYNPTIRPSADRPDSAFGIRTQSPGRGGPVSQALRASQPPQLGGNLNIPPAGVDPNRGRPVSASAGWAPQVPAGYRQVSPGPRGQDYGRPASAQYDPRLSAPPVGSGGPAPNNPAHNRLTKTNPNPPGMQATPPAQFPSGGYGAPIPPQSQPGRDYGVPGPRTTSRPASGGHDPYSGRSSAAPSVASHTMSSGGPGPRTDSLGSMSSFPSVATGGARASSARPGVPLKDRPLDYGPGRASAPPNQGRPNVASPPTASSGAMGAPAGRPAAGGKHSKNSASGGPATFEEMGIPQGKHDDDCVSFPRWPPPPTFNLRLTGYRLSCKHSTTYATQAVDGHRQHGRANGLNFSFNDTNYI